MMLHNSSTVLALLKVLNDICNLACGRDRILVWPWFVHSLVYYALWPMSVLCLLLSCLLTFSVWTFILQSQYHGGALVFQLLYSMFKPSQPQAYPRVHNLRNFANYRCLVGTWCVIIWTKASCQQRHVWVLALQLQWQSLGRWRLSAIYFQQNSSDLVNFNMLYWFNFPYDTWGRKKLNSSVISEFYPLHIVYSKYISRLDWGLFNICN